MIKLWNFNGILYRSIETIWNNYIIGATHLLKCIARKNGSTRRKEGKHGTAHWYQQGLRNFGRRYAPHGILCGTSPVRGHGGWRGILERNVGKLPVVD